MRKPWGIPQAPLRLGSRAHQLGDSYAAPVPCAGHPHCSAGRAAGMGAPSRGARAPAHAPGRLTAAPASWGPGPQGRGQEGTQGTRVLSPGRMCERPPSQPRLHRSPHTLPLGEGVTAQTGALPHPGAPSDGQRALSTTAPEPTAHHQLPQWPRQRGLRCRRGAGTRASPGGGLPAPAWPPPPAGAREPRPGPPGELRLPEGWPIRF